MDGILLAESAIFAEFQFLFHLLLVTLGVVCDAATETAFELHQRIFNLSHTGSIDKLFKEAFGKPFYSTAKPSLRQYS